MGGEGGGNLACKPGPEDFTATAVPGVADFEIGAFVRGLGATAGAGAGGADFVMAIFLACMPPSWSSAGRFRPCTTFAALLGFGAELLRSCACKELSFGALLAMAIRNLLHRAG